MAFANPRRLCEIGNERLGNTAREGEGLNAVWRLKRRIGADMRGRENIVSSADADRVCGRGLYVAE